MEGGCNCGFIRYAMLTAPLIVSACHCTRCQRRTGGPFGINAYIESDRVGIINDSEPELAYAVTSEYGSQIYSRCPECLVNLWYTFEAEGGHVKFVRVSTLDEARKIVPRVHIWTSSKVPWVAIPEGALAFEEGYDDREAVWEKESLEREKAFVGKQQAYFERWMEENKKDQGLDDKQDEAETEPEQVNAYAEEEGNQTAQ